MIGLFAHSKMRFGEDRELSGLGGGSGKCEFMDLQWGMAFGDGFGLCLGGLASLGDKAGWQVGAGFRLRVRPRLRSVEVKDLFEGEHEIVGGVAVGGGEEGRHF
jgi:hypothetical protein